MENTSDTGNETVRLFSVGHSNRSAEAFVLLLGAHGVTRIADVRSAPFSRRHPQFSREALAARLARAGVDYVHLPELGGMRSPRPDSRHFGLAAGGFRGYADHMGSAAFRRGCERLIGLARERPTAIMCAEADPAHCHRSLLADALLAGGASVTHLLDPARKRPHTLHPAAVVSAGVVAYPGPPELFDPPGGAGGRSARPRAGIGRQVQDGPAR